jgi:hypothetical protein
MIPRFPPEALEAAIGRSVLEQGKLIKAALIEEGYDPETNEPMPASIANRIAERLGAGEFDVPVKIRPTDIPQEVP